MRARAAARLALCLFILSFGGAAIILNACPSERASESETSRPFSLRVLLNVPLKNGVAHSYKTGSGGQTQGNKGGRQRAPHRIEIQLSEEVLVFLRVVQHGGDWRLQPCTSYVNHRERKHDMSRDCTVCRESSWTEREKGERGWSWIRSIPASCQLLATRTNATM
jgi:hypothetical protein